MILCLEKHINVLINLNKDTFIVKKYANNNSHCKKISDYVIYVNTERI